MDIKFKSQQKKRSEINISSSFTYPTSAVTFTDFHSLSRVSLIFASYHLLLLLFNITTVKTGLGIGQKVGLVREFRVVVGRV